MSRSNIFYSFLSISGALKLFEKVLKTIKFSADILLRSCNGVMTTPNKNTKKLEPSPVLTPSPQFWNFLPLLLPLLLEPFSHPLTGGKKNMKIPICYESLLFNITTEKKNKKTNEIKRN